MDNDILQKIFDELKPLFLLTDQVLNEWNGEGSLQFPTLMTMLAAKANWSEKIVRQNDPIIRFYIRRHPDWHVRAGAHGGIQRATDIQKKKDEKIAKLTAKKEAEAIVDAKISIHTSDQVEGK